MPGGYILSLVALYLSNDRSQMLADVKMMSTNNYGLRHLLELLLS